MSKVLSLRLKPQQMERLQRAARRLGRTPSEAAAMLLEEGLRRREFAFIEFRDSFGGRQAYLQGTRLAIWQVVWLARFFDGSAVRAAEHLEIAAETVKAALGYAEAFPEEIEAAISDQAEASLRLRGLVPGLEVFNAGGPRP